MNHAKKLTGYGIIIIAGLFLSQIQTATAATYYKCMSGYNFQTVSDAARCYKPQSTSYKSLNRCASVHIPIANKSIGHFYKKNHQGNKDMCVGTFKIAGITNTNAVEITCPSGYAKQILSGKDRCRKTIPSKVKAPDIRVNK